jgi:hypothetical protein
MARLNINRQIELEPKRMQFAKDALLSMSIPYICPTDKSIQFEFEGKVVTFFPYSGWFSGKSVVPGRGIQNLLKQISSK